MRERSKDPSRMLFSRPSNRWKPHHPSSDDLGAKTARIHSCSSASGKWRRSSRSRSRLPSGDDFRCRMALLAFINVWPRAHSTAEDRTPNSRQDEISDFVRASENPPALFPHRLKGGPIPLAIGRLSGNVPDEDPDDLGAMIAGQGPIDLGVLLP